MGQDPGVPVGPVLRRFRLERGWTIEQTAQRVKLHPVYYGEVERGHENPTARVIHLTLRALGRTWSEFGAAVDEQIPAEQR
jgi:transcriptional regulator with XRE-family HTH domain